MRKTLLLFIFSCLILISCKKDDHLTAIPVEIADTWDNAGAHLFVPSMQIGYVEDNKVILNNNQGIYCFKKQDNVYHLVSSLSLDMFGYQPDISSDYDQIFFGDDLVYLTKEIENSKEQNKVKVYEYIYGSEIIKQKICSWDEVEKIPQQKKPSTDDIQVINQLLSEKNYVLFGDVAMCYSNKIGFLLLDPACVNDMSTYQKYGEYNQETQNIQIYELDYRDSVFVGKYAK